MDEPGVNLVAAWRDATLAADLAQRLATSALHAADEADRFAGDAEHIAELAERAARSADEVAAAARTAAGLARQRATRMRTGLTEADRELEHAAHERVDPPDGLLPVAASDGAAELR
jgi:methyl-accepting chemotaxis protein